LQEWAPLGDVFEDRRKSKGPLSEERAVKEVVQPLMFALQYMHKQGIIHRYGTSTKE
jgi:serine/threonine protein kinase